MLNSLIDVLPPEIGDLEEIYVESLEYSSTVAIPPYFADTQPTMPAQAIYVPTMGPDAFPMQLIRFPLDGYTPRLFFDVGIDGTDLEALYETVASLPTPNTPPLAETAPAPATLSPSAVSRGTTTSTPSHSAIICGVMSWWLVTWQ